MSEVSLELEALDLLRSLTGNPEAQFREDQLEAIELMVRGERSLVVQPTGWGKSAVYLIATKLRRDRGFGPTILISPLLALMKNQVDAATRLPLRAAEWNSNNRDEWPALYSRLRGGDVDLLLVSPERLSRADFRGDVLSSIRGGIGALVVDEAHCISDWGHDFRPDYRRIKAVVDILPPTIPVLATTATANDRVVEDIEQQVEVKSTLRGPLDRKNLALHVLPVLSLPDRMAWIAQVVSELPGSGIVYSLTVAEAERQRDWLVSQGITAAVYTGNGDKEEKAETLKSLDAGEIDVVVATTALGMGYDNPYLTYIIHFHAPGSIVTYYQQVGRAGRANQPSLGVLMQSSDDARIQGSFIKTAFPLEDEAREVLTFIDSRDGVLRYEVDEQVNVATGRVTNILKLLEIEGAIRWQGGRFYATAVTWTYDHDRVDAVTSLRRQEQREMREYAQTSRCLMDFLRLSLGDRSAERCGRCGNCTGQMLSPTVAEDAVSSARQFLRSRKLEVKPRLKMPDGTWIPWNERLEAGRALGLWSDEGWADLIRLGKTGSGFDPRISARLIALVRHWRPNPIPRWVTFIPSLGHPSHVPDLAEKVAGGLDLPLIKTIEQTKVRVSQRDLRNSSMQAANVSGHFDIVATPPNTPGLLIDDIAHSGWTLTIVGGMLKRKGAGPIYPLVVVKTQ